MAKTKPEIAPVEQEVKVEVETEAPAPKMDPLALILGKLEGLEQRLGKLEEGRTKGLGPQGPTYDAEETAAIRSRDPVAIVTFAQTRGEKEGWGETKIKEYGHDLLRVAMNTAQHDPMGDRLTLMRPVNEPVVKKHVTQTNSGGTHECVVKLN